MKRNIIALVMILGVLYGCSPGQPGKSASNVGNAARPLTNAEFNNLTPEQQYQVADKLLGTLFKGMPVTEFFDVRQGTRPLRVSGGRDFISKTAETLGSELSEAERNRLTAAIFGNAEAVDVNGEASPIPPKYLIDARAHDMEEGAKQYPLAVIYEYPLSREVFLHWIAYTLTNTILFSPAEEIDSVNNRDVNAVYNRLYAQMYNGATVREMVLSHQGSVQNWRRFRSPEDNTREMIEIYLGLFDRDADVPRAATACQNYSLLDQDQGYELLITDDVNAVPQKVLGTYVTTCPEFFQLIAGHPLVIPRTVAVLVSRFFAETPEAERVAIVKAIVGANPKTFEEIFKHILFSRAYLLNAERPRAFEENLLATGQRLKWTPHQNVFRDMTSKRNNRSLLMKDMGWAVMSFKLGRLLNVPMDTLSFANYHRGFRETLLIEKQGNYRQALIHNPDQLEANAIPQISYIEALSADDFLDYAFLSAALRLPSDYEREYLKSNVFNGWLNNDGSMQNRFVEDIAHATFDYISRLPETYYFRRVN